MSKDVNKVILIGRLGQDIDLRYTGNGKAVVNCTLATSSGKQGNEKTEWHRLVVWEKAAEIMAQYCGKGSRLYVEGRLDTRKWQHSDGSDRYSTEVIVWEFIMLDSKGDAPSKPPEKPMRDDDGPSAPSSSAYDDLPF